MTQDQRDIAALAYRVLNTPVEGTAHSLDDVVEMARADRERRTRTDSDVWMALEAMTLNTIMSDHAKLVLKEAMRKL